MKNIMIKSLTSDVSITQLENLVALIKDNKVAISPELKSYPYDKTLWYGAHSEKYLSKLHSLKMIQYLLLYYKKFNDYTCVEKALSFFYLWFEENFPKSRYENCFHGDIIGIRLKNVCDLLSVSKELDLCILDDVFIKVISHHTSILAENVHNLYQQMNLIIASIVYNHYYINNAYDHYLKTASKNIKIILDQLIINGNYLGHSLKKAYLLYIKLLDYHTFLLENTNLLDLADFIKHKNDELYVYIFSFLLPGGLVPFGENFKLHEKLFITYPHAYSTHYAFKFSNGKIGEKDLTPFFFYQKTNILVVNNHNEPNYQLTFTNHFSSTVNKHQDNLSFTLFYKNAFIFIDSGEINIEDESKKTYLSSIYAHNTICLDYHDFLVEESQKHQCGIVNFSVTKFFTFACGVHTLYEDTIIKRSILTLDPLILIFDELISHDTHDYEIIFNLNPKIYLKVNNEKGCLGFIGEEQFQLRELYSTMKLEYQYEYGNKEKNIGFTVENNKLTPSHTIIFHGRGKNELVISAIILGEKDPNIKINVDVNNIYIDLNNDKYQLIRGEYHHEIRRNNEITINQINPNKTLWKEMKAILSQK